jgi:hypothetical protein
VTVPENKEGHHDATRRGPEACLPPEHATALAYVLTATPAALCVATEAAQVVIIAGADPLHSNLVCTSPGIARRSIFWRHQLYYAGIQILFRPIAGCISSRNH